MSPDPRQAASIERTNPLGVPLDVPRVHAVSPQRPKLWECPEHCGAAARTVDSKIPYHPCTHHGGTLLRLVEAGTRAAYVPVPREDDVRAEVVQPVRERRRGRLLMAVDTVRDDGYDRTVFAPTASADMED
jgi:hypothetical protein